VESLRKGLSGMDAARAVMGQGWPFAASPWSNDGAREPDEVGPDARGKTFWLLLGQLPKVTRRKGGTGSCEQHTSGVCTQTSKKERGQIYFMHYLLLLVSALRRVTFSLRAQRKVRRPRGRNTVERTQPK